MKRQISFTHLEDPGIYIIYPPSNHPQVNEAIKIAVQKWQNPGWLRVTRSTQKGVGCFDPKFPAFFFSDEVVGAIFFLRADVTGEEANKTIRLISFLCFFGQEVVELGIVVIYRYHILLDCYLGVPGS